MSIFEEDEYRSAIKKIFELKKKVTGSRSLEEQHYLNLLYAHNRSGLDRRKKIILKEIVEIQETKRLSSSKIKAAFTKPTPADEMLNYYLDPDCFLVHMALTIPRLQKDPTLLAPALELTKSKVDRMIRNLEQMGIIKQECGKIVLIQDHIH